MNPRPSSCSAPRQGGYLPLPLVDLYAKAGLAREPSDELIALECLSILETLEPAAVTALLRSRLLQELGGGLRSYDVLWRTV